MNLRSTWLEMVGALALMLLAVGLTLPVSAQIQPEVYQATAIPSEGVSGASGRIVARISSQTGEAEKTSLLAAFKVSSEAGMTLLRTKSKGIVEIENDEGRKIYAAFTRTRDDGSEIILICEHAASKLQVWKGTVPDGDNVSVVHIRLGIDGKAKSGEIFPAVQLTLTPDGYVDVQTNGTNKVMLIGISKR